TGFVAIAATGTTSAGSAGQVTRRVELVAKTSSGAQQFSVAGIQSQTNITVSGGSQQNNNFYASTWANGSISMSAGRICGQVTVGPGGSFTGGTWFTNYNPTQATPCSGTGNQAQVPHQTLFMPPVNQ